MWYILFYHWTKLSIYYIIDLGTHTILSLLPRVMFGISILYYSVLLKEMSR